MALTWYGTLRRPAGCDNTGTSQKHPTTVAGQANGAVFSLRVEFLITPQPRVEYQTDKMKTVVLIYFYRSDSQRRTM